MLKAAAMAAALVLVCGRPAAADTLLTGVVRDRSGAAVAGARIAAYDGAGQPVGSDVTIADGTFALDVQTPPAQLAVACDYCRSIRTAIDPAQPIVVIIDRYSDVSAPGPSADDIRALPYRSGLDIASLQPFTVVNNGAPSDRGLDYEGAVLVDGLPFYRAADGDDFIALVPAHAPAALNVAGPLAAPAYGGYADAGVYDLRLHDPDVATSRLDIGDASDALLRLASPDVEAAYAASNDVGDDRQEAYADASLPLAGGRLDIEALGMSDLADHASGAGIAYATDSRRYSTAASLSATQTDDASLVTATAQVRDRGPFNLTFGIRAARATTTLDAVAGAQFDAAVYVAATRQSGTNTLSALAAWDRGADSGVTGAAPSAGLIGSLSDDLRLGADWTLHAGVVSSLRVPTLDEVANAAPVGSATDRQLLFEQSIRYTDRHRLRVTGMAYTQRSTGSTTGFVNGIGIDAAWQIAPQLVVRSWILRANQTSIPLVVPGYEYYQTPVTLAGPLTRQLVWFTYGSGIRVDALVRGGPLEGDVRIPISAAGAFTIGSARYNGRRVTTFGLSQR